MTHSEWSRSAERSREWLYDIMACPVCKHELSFSKPGEGSLSCCDCGRTYPWLMHIPVLIEQEDLDPGLLRLANGWNRAAPVWSSNIAKSKDVLDATERPLLQGLSGTVLEVGCGDGRLFPQYEALGIRAIGIDFSVEMLVRAAPKGIPLALADAHGLPFKDNSMGAVIVPFATIRFLEYERFFSEVFRILKPGGMLRFVAWNDRYNFRYQRPSFDWRSGRDVRQIREIRDPLLAAGFTLQSIDGIFSFPRWIPFLSRFTVCIPGGFGATVARDIVICADKAP